MFLFVTGLLNHWETLLMYYHDYDYDYNYYRKLLLIIIIK